MSDCGCAGRQAPTCEHVVWEDRKNRCAQALRGIADPEAFVRAADAVILEWDRPDGADATVLNEDIERMRAARGSSPPTGDVGGRS